MRLIDRFESKFERITESGCWIWNAAIFPARGYGAFNHPPEQLAHRVAWILYRGQIPHSACVLHRCDVPACVNPDHLFLGTQSDNMVDKVRKCRQSKGVGTGVAKITETQAIAIRSDPRKQVEIATEYGISQSIVSSIKLRKTWKWLDGADYRYQRKR